MNQLSRSPDVVTGDLTLKAARAARPKARGISKNILQILGLRCRVVEGVSYRFDICRYWGRRGLK